MAIIDNGKVRLPDGHPLKRTQNDFEAKQPLSPSNAFPKYPGPPIGANAERVAVSGTSSTALDATGNQRRATLHLPPRQPRRGPMP